MVLFQKGKRRKSNQSPEALKDTARLVFRLNNFFQTDFNYYAFKNVAACNFNSAKKELKLTLEFTDRILRIRK